MFAGVGERTREGNDLYWEMIESGVNKNPKENNGSSEGSRCALVFGQMNEPPGARARVALSGLAQAEYFGDEEGKDVLFFVDNIFRFTQAGAEVSALLGRIPSAVGYQPTLATDMGAAAGTHHLDQQGFDHLGAGRLRAGRRPGPTRPRPPPSPTLMRRQCSTARISEKGIYPAVDPLDSTSRILEPAHCG